MIVLEWCRQWVWRVIRRTTSRCHWNMGRPNVMSGPKLFNRCGHRTAHWEISYRWGFDEERSGKTGVAGLWPRQEFWHEIRQIMRFGAETHHADLRTKESTRLIDQSSVVGMCGAGPRSDREGHSIQGVLRVLTVTDELAVMESKL